MFLQNFQSIISLQVLKLVFNKSMRMSDDEQGINKLWPNHTVMLDDLSAYCLIKSDNLTTYDV